MKVGILSLLLALAGVVIPVAAQAVAQTYQLDIPRQQLDAALKDLAQQTGLQIARFSDTPGGSAFVGPIKGDMPVADALKTLLLPSNLTYKIVNDHTIAVMTLSAAATPTETTQTSIPSQTHGDPKQQEERKSLWDNFRLAQANQGTAQRSSTVGSDVQASSASSENSPQLTEILVTAQKRVERLQDVPVPVTVLDPQSLAEQDKNRLQDYFATVPGLTVTQGNLGGGQIPVLRGLTTGYAANPTVGVTIDDVPYGPSTSLAGGNFLVPDLDPSDLARIEVLRGPQGTLYGANSLGGLIKYVTIDPSTLGFSGSTQVLGEGVEHGELGYGFRAAVNVPLSDTLALRASGFMRRDPGYIDNVLTGQNDVNRVDVYGGRLSMLWRASDTVSLKLGAFLQNTDGDGVSAVDTDSHFQPTLGDLKQARLRGTEAYTTEARLYTAILNANLGNVNFTSVTGYSTNRYSQLGDNTIGFGSFALSGVPGTSFHGFGVDGAYVASDYDSKRFTQELRLASASGQKFEWLTGAFYSDERSPVHNTLGAINPATGSGVGVIADDYFPTTLSEYALFADLTYHILDRFDVQLGGRESWNRQVYNETDTGPGVPIFYRNPSPFINETERTTGNAFTYLLTPRFKITSDLMVYARFTSGYRFGGDNNKAVLGQVPTEYNPDKTNNYELGIKSELFDHLLTLDASAYYISWKNLQISIHNPLTYTSYVANAGNAKSQGLELSAQVRPTKGLTISVTGALIDATLTQNFPTTSDAIGFAGDRLPYTSRLTGNLSVDQDIALSSSWTGFLGGSLSYVGAREGEFVGFFSTAQRFQYPGYADLDLHTGAHFESWTVNLFVNNVTDRRGIAYGATGGGESTYYAVFTQPRTVGLSLSKKF